MYCKIVVNLLTLFNTVFIYSVKLFLYPYWSNKNCDIQIVYTLTNEWKLYDTLQGIETKWHEEFEVVRKKYLTSLNKSHLFQHYLI